MSVVAKKKNRQRFVYIHYLKNVLHKLYPRITSTLGKTTKKYAIIPSNTLSNSSEQTTKHKAKKIPLRRNIKKRKIIYKVMDVTIDRPVVNATPCTWSWFLKRKTSTCSFAIKYFQLSSNFKHLTSKTAGSYLC